MNTKALQILDHMIEDCMDIAEGVKRAKTVQGIDKDIFVRKTIVFSILNLGTVKK